MFTVYERFNRVTGRSYVGYTSRTIEERWEKCVSRAEDELEKLRRWNLYPDRSTNARKIRAFNVKLDSEKTLTMAIVRYGSGDAWCHHVLETNENIIDALLAEQKWIDALDAQRVGYNCTAGGEMRYHDVVHVIDQVMKSNWFSQNS